MEKTALAARQEVTVKEPSSPPPFASVESDELSPCSSDGCVFSPLNRY